MDDTDPVGHWDWGWVEGGGEGGSLGGVPATDKKTGKVYNVLLLIMTGGSRLVFSKQ